MGQQVVSRIVFLFSRQALIFFIFHINVFFSLYVDLREKKDHGKR